MQLLIIKRRGAGSPFLLSNYPATAHMPGMGAKAGAPHAPIPNGGDVGMPKADEYKWVILLVIGGESHLKFLSSQTPKSTARLRRVDDGDLDRLPTHPRYLSLPCIPNLC